MPTPSRQRRSRTKKPARAATHSKAHAARVLRSIRGVLNAHGITGRVTHMSMNITASDGECPAGQTLRMVCEPDENGTTRCEFKCVPD